MSAREFTSSDDVVLTCSNFASGLVGTIGCRIVDLEDGTTAVARATAGITEDVSGSGVYRYEIAANPGPGRYQDMWDPGSVGPNTVAVDEFEITGPALTFDVTLASVSDRFPVGTSVGAYLITAFPFGGSGGPTDSAETTATVASGGSLTFTDLRAGEYYAAAQINGVWVRTGFSAG